MSDITKALISNTTVGGREDYQWDEFHKQQRELAETRRSQNDIKDFNNMEFLQRYTASIKELQIEFVSLEKDDKRRGTITRSFYVNVDSSFVKEYEAMMANWWTEASTELKKAARIYVAALWHSKANEVAEANDIELPVEGDIWSVFSFGSRLKFVSGQPK